MGTLFVPTRRTYILHLTSTYVNDRNVSIVNCGDRPLDGDGFCSLVDTLFKVNPISWVLGYPTDAGIA